MVEVMKNYLDKQRFLFKEMDIVIKKLKAQFPGYDNEFYVLVAAEYLNEPLKKYEFTSKFTYSARNEEEAREFFADNSLNFAAEAILTEITNDENML